MNMPTRVPPPDFLRWPCFLQGLAFVAAHGFPFIDSGQDTPAGPSRSGSPGGPRQPKPPGVCAGQGRPPACVRRCTSRGIRQPDPQEVESDLVGADPGGSPLTFRQIPQLVGQASSRGFSRRPGRPAPGRRDPRPLGDHRADAGVGVLDVIDRVLVGLALGEIEVEVQVLVGFAQGVKKRQASLPTSRRAVPRR